MNDKVVHLRATTTMTVEQALQSALKASGRLTEVIIIGHNDDGEIFSRSSRMSRRDALWLLEVYKHDILPPREQS